MFSHESLNTISDFTVMFWIKADAPAEDVAARLLTKAGAWEVMYGRGQPALLLVNGETKTPSAFAERMAQVEGWVFVALSLNNAAKRIERYWGERGAGLVGPYTAEATLLPAESASPLEIGNFNGIRPFKGKMDNLRIYPLGLTGEQVKRVFERDIASWGKGRPIYTLAQPPVAERRFQPKHSDIFFSSRWQRMKGNQKEELLGLLRAFHVTHLLWVYGSNPDFIRDVRSTGVFYEGTLNGECGSDKATRDPSAEGDTTGRQRDFDGNKVIHNHMKKWKKPPLAGCHNSLDFRAIFWAEAEKLVAAGADGIMVDDWEMSAGTARAGVACLCPSCMAGFRDYLKSRLSAEELKKVGIEDIAVFAYRAFLKAKCGIENAEQYKTRFRELPLTPQFLDFQRESLRVFFADFRKHLDAISPQKYITLAVNCQFRWKTHDGRFIGDYCVDLFDFLDGEGSKGMQTVNDYVQPCKVAEAYGIPQVMQTKPPQRGANYAIGPPSAALATSYALGQWFLVPWDLYMDNDAAGQPAPRYFGTVAEWGAYYDFIRDNPYLSNDYQTAATVGVLFNADALPYAPVAEMCKRLTEIQAQFCLIPAASKFTRIPVDGEMLKRFSCIINVSPMESYNEEDRKTLDAVRASFTTRFLSPDADIEKVLTDNGLLPIRVEGPRNIYAFLRVKPDAAVIHVVNWNALPDGSAADPFAHITLSLSDPARWGRALQVKYYQPGQKGAIDLQPEMHHDFVRITLPRLETWGVVEVKPQEADH
ncbi:MAG: LamG-like jellyroll fold domain-containing protein [Planctomycetota bacterium]